MEGLEIVSGQLESTPTCPHCEKSLGGYTDIDQTGAKPRAGDVSICAYCKHILIFITAYIGPISQLVLDYMPPDLYLEYDGLMEQVPALELNGRLVCKIGFDG